MTNPGPRPTVLLTINVRDYFQASAFADAVRPQDWEWYPSRYPDAVNRILELLSIHGARATFFVLGWHARHQPEVVRQIAAAGHEVACSTHPHRPFSEMAPAEFSALVRQSREAVEDAAGVPVAGWRAPAYSLHPRHEWAFKVLESLGFAYDSSLAPRGRRRDATEQPPAFRLGDMWEVPPSRINWIGRRFLPDTGAMRHLPWRVFRQLLKRTVDRSPTRPVLCLSSWEVDPEQPRLRTSFSRRMLHFHALESTGWKLNLLLSQFRTLGVMDALQRGGLLAAQEEALEGIPAGSVPSAPRTAWWRLTL